MLFKDTFKLLEEFKCVGRSSGKVYIFILPHVPTIWAVNTTNEAAQLGQYVPTIQDLLADDWEVIQ